MQNEKLKEMLPINLYTILKKLGIKTLEDLTKFTERDICRINGIGSNYMLLLKQLLTSNNLNFNDDKYTISGVTIKANRKKMVTNPYVLRALKNLNLSDTKQLSKFTIQDLEKQLSLAEFNAILNLIEDLDIHLKVENSSNLTT